MTRGNSREFFRHVPLAVLTVAVLTAPLSYLLVRSDPSAPALFVAYLAIGALGGGTAVWLATHLQRRAARKQESA